MKIALIISEAARANPGDSRIGRLAGTLSKPSALVVGMGILFRRTGLTVPVLHGKLGTLLAQTANWELELAAAAMLASYAGGAFIMSLKEKIMKPLMDAQYEKDIEIGSSRRVSETRGVEGTPESPGRNLRPRPGGRDGRRP